MSDVQFFKTRMGEKFICKTEPDLIRQLERLNKSLEKLVEQKSPGCDGKSPCQGKRP